MSIRGRASSQRRGQPRSTSRLQWIATWSIIALAALVPLPFGSVYAAAWGVWGFLIGAMSVIYFLLQARSTEAISLPRPLAIPAILMAVTGAYMLVQTLPIGQNGLTALPVSDVHPDTISVAPGLTMHMIMRQLSYAVLAFVVLQVCQAEKVQKLILNAFVVIVIAYGLYGLISLQSGDTILGMAKVRHLGSATGPFFNRNSFATFLAFGAVVTLALGGAKIVRQSRRHANDGHIPRFRSSLLIYAVAYFFILVTIVATQSRMGLFAAIAGSAFVIVATSLAASRLRLLLLAAPIGIVAIALALLAIGGGLLSRLEFYNFTLEDRGELYRQTLNLIALRPWTGFGGDSFEVAFAMIHEAPLSSQFVWDRAHNSYLSLWANLGLGFGTLPMLALGIIGLLMLRRLIIGGSGSWSAATAGVGVLIVAAVHSLTDYSLEIQANAIVFTIILAVGAASATSGSRRNG